MIMSSPATTINEHWRDGKDDVERTFSHPAWIYRERPKDGVRVLDLTRDLDPPNTEALPSRTQP